MLYGAQELLHPVPLKEKGSSLSLDKSLNNLAAAFDTKVNNQQRETPSFEAQNCCLLSCDAVDHVPRTHVETSYNHGDTPLCTH